VLLDELVVDVVDGVPELDEHAPTLPTKAKTTASPATKRVA
jgi:hypothetical protein